VSSYIKEAKQEPEMVRRGKLVNFANPRPEVSKNAENASDWPFCEETRMEGFALFDEGTIHLLDSYHFSLLFLLLGNGVGGTHCE
jgi:hypothetical protein